MVETRKIIFSHTRAVGDTLMFTAGVRDFKLLFPNIQIGIRSSFPELWQNNPYIDHDLKEGEYVEFYKVGYPIINNANMAATTFAQGFLFDMIACAEPKEKLPLSLGQVMAAFANGRAGDPDYSFEQYNLFRAQNDGGLQQLPEHLKELFPKNRALCQIFGRHKGDIHLTKEEKHRNVIKENFNVDRYWIIAPGGKRDCTCKVWDWRRFQKIIDYYDGLMKFVVIGRSDHLVESLNGVIDLTDKYRNDLRGLFSLIYHAEGAVTGVSLLMHAIAAIDNEHFDERDNMVRVSRKPCVVIYGGREPTRFTAYTGHQTLHTGGALTCCDYGGCWHSRVVPLQKDKDKNNRLCNHTVVSDGRTIQHCMDIIKSEDVLRAIQIYYEGNKFEPLKKTEKVDTALVPTEVYDINTGVSYSVDGKEINILASLQSKGGGEQSSLKIAKMLRDSGWKVNFYAWDKIHQNWDLPEHELSKYTFKAGMVDFMQPGIPLLFYANDQIWDFCNTAELIVNKSSYVIIGINYCNGTLPKCTWLDRTKKLKAIIFQNTEKREEFDRDAIGFDYTKRIVLYGAIELDRFLEVITPDRTGNQPLIILKHCTPDWRKYVTSESENKGEKIHLWQKHIFKEKDTAFYTRLLHDTKNTEFYFMEAHSELVGHFKAQPRMKFFKWNEVPVETFLKHGHCYLYRTSNMWRDQYPRVVAEALAAGLPVITEPRDGTKDRVVHGETGFHCIDYDAFLYAVRILQRKEGMRRAMAMEAKDWARKNLRPEKWVETIENILT